MNHQEESTVKKQLACAALAAVVFASGSGLAFAQAAAAPKPQAPAAASQPAVDQAIEQLRKDARADINTLITASMQFSSEDAAKFWPLYKNYEQVRKSITDERLTIIKDYAQNYAAMSDAKALELMQRAFALEEKAAAAKKGFLGELQKTFPGKFVARFYQVHTRIDILVDAMLSGEIPLVR
jgi:folylpolyglutamate synthase/dihydropteroate synthase